jgi:beta-galactosidase/beta-glucuronidase
MRRNSLSLLLFIHFVLIAIILSTGSGISAPVTIPLPEHPRPDFQRDNWINLNGQWEFEFDGDNNGIEQKWFEKSSFSKRILVPFPWGSPMSGIKSEADIGWYMRKIFIPNSWTGSKVFLNIGASDWVTDAWIDGIHVGSFQGGYTPFEFDLTEHIQAGEEHNLVIRVDDTPHDFKLFGKQGYGEAKGIWQTLYLESRGTNFIDHIHFSPDIESSSVEVNVQINEAVKKDLQISLNIKDAKDSIISTTHKFRKKKVTNSFTINLPNPRL